MERAKTPDAEQNEQSYTSPPYTRRRTSQAVDRRRDNRREQNHRSPNLQWRPKSPVLNQEVTPPSAPFIPHTSVERNLDVADFPPLPVIPSREEVMEELRVVTLQYMNCPDPVEREARKQRVLQSELNGVVEETATHILQASTSAALASLAAPQTLNLSEIPIHEEGPADVPETHTRKRGRPPKVRDNRNVIRLSPKSYSGMGSKKRNLVRLQASPGSTSRVSRQSRTSTRQNRASTTSNAPPIVLIPAISRQQTDFPLLTPDLP